MKSEEITKFIHNVFNPSLVNNKITKVDVSFKYDIPKVVVYFEHNSNLDEIVALTNDKVFPGNETKITVQKFMSQVDRMKLQTEKEKAKPLDVLYLVGLKPNITSEQIIQEILKLTNNEDKPIKVSLKQVTYS